MNSHNVALQLVSLTAIMGCSPTRGMPIRCAALANGQFETLINSAGTNMTATAVVTSDAGYWMADDALSIFMRSEDLSIDVGYKDIVRYGTMGFDIRVSSEGETFRLNQDCSVFWPDGAIQETMNVVDGVFYAHLAIDTSGVADGTPPECGPLPYLRLAIEGMAPLVCKEIQPFDY